MRSELARHQADRDNIAFELKAVSHHRAVLRDTVEQLERQVRQKADKIADLEFQLDSQAQQYDRYNEDVDTSMVSASGGDNGGDDELRRQVVRYKARAAAMEELSVTYRVSIMALYADGASYGAAQFGWQPFGESSSSSGTDGSKQQADSAVVTGLGVGWIEREMTAIKHCYEDEIRLLDNEVNDLRAQLRQSRSFTTELRRRFEDSMKSLYRLVGKAFIVWLSGWWCIREHCFV